MQLVPLVWAHTNGVRILGANLEIPAAHKYVMAREWADLIVPGAATVTFLAGRIASTHVYAAPVALSPRQEAVAMHEDTRLRMQRAGVAFAWLSLAALVGTPLYETVSHAVLLCGCLRSEMSEVPLGILPGQGGSYRLGVTGVTSLIDSPDGIRATSTSLEQLASRVFHDNNLLITGLLADTSEYAADMKDWAAQIAVPPLAEVPSDLFQRSPVFADARLDHLAYPVIPKPPHLEWPPRMPQQRKQSALHCPRRARDLMPIETWRRVERWLLMTLEDLICIRDQGEACDRRTIGVDRVFSSWARVSYTLGLEEWYGTFAGLQRNALPT
ncbi:hypothetical protein AB1Y20_003481 [Prymnesium parvum]|uniref:Uncharacterized protein n=1 Tax=Prymnesium parvum TaxID=97485 RepID=A0AB34JDN4_PRYPA